MRTALVQCPPWGSLPPLGLASLKAYLEPRGRAVRCFDLNIDYCRERLAEALDDAGGSVYARPDPLESGSYDEWAFDIVDGEIQFRGTLRKRPLPIDRWTETVLAWEPDVVGFSVQSSNLGVTLQTAKVMRRARPDLRIVFGGPNVAQAQQGALALRTGVPDAVVEGEGEETLVELLDAFEDGRDLATVAGIGLLRGGRPTWTEGRPLLKDVDAIPFADFSDFDWTAYPNPHEIPVMSSRGCVLKCAFCYETVYWKRYRTQSAERIVAEIEHQIAHHPLRSEVEARRARFGISFADSLVNGHLGGLRRTAELLVERDHDVFWNGQATINDKMDDAYFALLARSGCTGLSFGLESGSPLVLESMGKRFDLAEATDFFRRAERSGIEIVANIMVGFPTETRREFLETLRFLYGIRRSVYMVNNVGATAVVGGSRLHSDPDQFGIVPVDLAGWRSGENLQWRSAEAGDQSERDRRVRVLHAWMTLLRIPHQRIGRSSRRFPKLIPARRRRRLDRLDGVSDDARQPPTPVATASSPTMRTRRVDRQIAALQRSAGAEPLVLQTSDGAIDAALTRPTWAAPLEPETWIGVPLLELRGRVTDALGSGAIIGQRDRPDGVQHVRFEVDDPRPGQLAGLSIRVFPPVTVGGPQRIALVPSTAADRPADAEATQGR